MPETRPFPQRTAIVLTAIIGVLAVSAGLYLVVEHFDLASVGTVSELLSGFPVLGPVLLILLMAGAVVISPIPSAPITLAAGAVYGHLWGTVYALIGAEIGALIAFEIARRLGRESVARWVGDRSVPAVLTSQIGLSTAVFVARLVPAVSFDVVSYAAGLTELRRRWFAIATVSGMVPATFLLSHTGAGLRASQGGAVDVLVGLAGLGVLALGGVFLSFRTKRRRSLRNEQEIESGGPNDKDRT
ncbi:TVP38/TMEM64 family protein [Pacificispira sp.]|uniref:TVP38/TMEM64 family protein n=1 Tax=Pacificispira sp. TaxID=2888761 RepID=UPI003BAC12BB